MADVLRNATAEDLERWAKRLTILAENVTVGLQLYDHEREAMVALSALARAVAKAERNGECRVEQSLIPSAPSYIVADVPLVSYGAYGPHRFCAALVSLLEDTDNG